MITTRNRGEDLGRTLRILRGMNPPPDELIVTLDACTDDSKTVIEREFPSAILLSNDFSCGSVASRDAMLHKAKGDWVVSLDDDSYPVDSDFFPRLVNLLTDHPEVAVMTFPELRENGNYSSENKTPQTLGHYTAAYANCAAAMNRKFYLEQPGFPASFVHMYEEPDFALQCYGDGAAVWFEPSLVIRHHLSNVQRHPVPRHHQNARNELWSVWMRCPWPQLPLVSAYRILRQLIYALSQGLWWVLQEPQWWLRALHGWGECRRHRRPIAWSTYLGWIRLARRPVYSVKELKRVFPHLRLS